MGELAIHSWASKLPRSVFRFGGVSLLLYVGGAQSWPEFTHESNYCCTQWPACPVAVTMFSFCSLPCCGRWLGAGSAQQSTEKMLGCSGWSLLRILVLPSQRCFWTTRKWQSCLNFIICLCVLLKCGLNISATLNSVWLGLGLCFNMLKFQHMFSWMRALVYRWQV